LFKVLDPFIHPPFLTSELVYARRQYYVTNTHTEREREREREIHTPIFVARF